MILLLLSSINQTSYAQKKGKKKSKVLTEEEIYQSDFYFIEAEKFFLIEDYSKALDMFNRSLEINDRNSAAHYKIAEIYLLDEKYLDALPHALKAKELDPNNKYYYILNAKLHVQIGDYPRAAANYEELFKRFEGNDDYLFDLANIYEYIDDPEKAIEVYEKIEHIYGQYAQITRQKQLMYMQMDQPEKAIEEWEKLIGFSPSVEHYTGYLEFLNEQGKTQKASQVLQRAIKDNPGSSSLQLLYSQIALENNDTEKSLEILKEPFADRSLDPGRKINTLLKIFPAVQPGTPDVEKVLSLTRLLVETHDEQFSVLAMAGDIHYQFKKPEVALDYYLKAVGLDETKFEVWQNILVIESQMGKFDQVIAHAEKAKEVFPNQALVYFYGGTAYQMTKQYKKAVYELERASRYARKNEDLLKVIYNQLGTAYNELRNYTRSDASFEKVLEIDPENSNALNNYSYYLSLRSEKLDKAERMSALLIDKYPGNASFLDTHGWVLYKKGEYKEARKVLEKAIKLIDTDGIIFEHYGDVLFKLGRKDEALTQWQKAKDVGSASDLIDKKIADRKLYE
ncbi:MAG: tetratricopeptide repeat protein [Cyclobacteriaceae bacterium]